MTKDWDLNIFFEEVWDDNVEEYVSDSVISINPVLYISEDGTPTVEYTEIVYKTTFAEARYLRSQYPEDEYGYDWTDSLDHFLEIAPPRLKSVLLTLPPAEETDIPKVKSLVG